ncbi:MAG: hypothetical protein AB1414_19970 [bacterium]
MKKVLILILGLLILLPGKITFAELTKQDIAEIRTVVKEEIGYVNQRIDDLDNKLSTRINDLMGLFYVLLAGMFALVGFVIWDRRTALAPAIKQIEELNQKEIGLHEIKSK